VANPSVAVKSNNSQIIVGWKSIRAKGNNTVAARIFLKYATIFLAFQYINYDYDLIKSADMSNILLLQIQ